MEEAHSWKSRSLSFDIPHLRHNIDKFYKEQTVRTYVSVELRKHPKSFRFCNRSKERLTHMWQRLLLLEPGLLIRTRGRTGEFPVGEISRYQTATDVVVKWSLGSWSHTWSLSNVSGCGSTSLFGSHAGTHQIRDQSRALEDRNDSNNSQHVYTPNSLIHLSYSSPFMDVVDMHNILIIHKWFCPLGEDSGSLLTCRIVPCVQDWGQISLTDITVWDGVWEQLHPLSICCTLW